MYQILDRITLASAYVSKSRAALSTELRDLSERAGWRRSEKRKKERKKSEKERKEGRKERRKGRKEEKKEGKKEGKKSKEGKKGGRKREKGKYMAYVRKYIDCQVLSIVQVLKSDVEKSKVTQNIALCIRLHAVLFSCMYVIKLCDVCNSISTPDKST